MKKTKMNLESLNIESFVTESKVRGGAKEDPQVPTVITFGWWSVCCETYTID